MTDKDIPTAGAELPRPLARALARELSSDLVEAIERAMREAAAPTAEPHTIAAHVVRRINAAKRARLRDEKG